MNVVDFIKQNEGVRNSKYLDSLGIYTIGVGFNLTRPDAKTRLASVGADYDSIMDGTQSLTDDQINTLLNLDIQDCVTDLKTIFPNWNNLNPDCCLIMTDCRFNLGPNRFRGFRKMIVCVRNEDYNGAADNLQNSAWYGQVGVRGPLDCGILRAINNTTTT